MSIEQGILQTEKYINFYPPVESLDLKYQPDEVPEESQEIPTIDSIRYITGQILHNTVVLKLIHEEIENNIPPINSASYDGFNRRQRKALRRQQRTQDTLRLLEAYKATMSAQEDSFREKYCERDNYFFEDQEVSEGDYYLKRLYPLLIKADNFRDVIFYDASEPQQEYEKKKKELQSEMDVLLLLK